MFADEEPPVPEALDLWAAGVCVYEMAAGLPCFSGDDEGIKEAILARDVNDEPLSGVCDTARSVCACAAMPALVYPIVMWLPGSSRLLPIPMA